MNRSEFLKKKVEAEDTFDKWKAKRVMPPYISMCNREARLGYGSYNLVVTMEELAELQQEVSKWYRGKPNPTGMLEEIADVLVCIMCLQEICGFSTSDIYQAMNVKLNKAREWALYGESRTSQATEGEEKGNEDL